MPTTTTTTDTPTTWPPRRCPEWCGGGHRIGEHPGDQVHWGQWYLSPVRSWPDDEGPSGGPVDQMELGIRQDAASEKAVLELSRDEHPLYATLSPGDARVLAANLLRAADQVEGVSSGVLSPESMALLTGAMGTLTSVRDDLIRVFTASS